MTDTYADYWRGVVATAYQIAEIPKPGVTDIAVDYRAILFAAQLIHDLTNVNDENKERMAKAHTDMDTLIRRWHNFAVDGEW